MPACCGDVASPKVSCIGILGCRRLDGRGQRESIVLVKSAGFGSDPCATTIVTAHDLS